MKACPTVRKSFKWVFSLASLTFALVWIAGTSSYTLSLSNVKSIFDFAQCGYYIAHGGLGAADECSFRRQPTDREPYGFSFEHFPGSHWIATFPLWTPFAVASPFAVLLWAHDTRLTRRANAGKCTKCAYDCSGLAPDAKCPECGKLRS